MIDGGVLADIATSNNNVLNLTIFLQGEVKTIGHASIKFTSIIGKLRLPTDRLNYPFVDMSNVLYSA